jgi:hypothetical protein
MVSKNASISHDCRGQSIEGVVRRPFRSVAIRKPDELSLQDRLQHHPRRLLNDLVFQRGYAEWACLPITLWDEDALHRLRVVVATMNSVFQLDQALVDTLAIVLPGHLVHAGRRIFSEPTIRLL